MTDSSLTPGEAIAAAAARRGWDGDELADRIQVSRSLVATWLDGSVVPPDRFHRRLLETLEFSDEERRALTGELPEPIVDASDEPSPDAERPMDESPSQPDPQPPDPGPADDPGGPPPQQAPPEPQKPEPSTPAEIPVDEGPTAQRRGSGLSTGRAIQLARRRKGWTTRELASAIHYTRDEIEAWEDDASTPWPFALRAMRDVLEFSDEETSALDQAEDA